MPRLPRRRLQKCIHCTAQHCTLHSTASFALQRCTALLCKSAKLHCTASSFNAPIAKVHCTQCTAAKMQLLQKFTASKKNPETGNTWPCLTGMCIISSASASAPVHQQQFIISSTPASVHKHQWISSTASAVHQQCKFLY